MLSSNERIPGIERYEGLLNAPLTRRDVVWRGVLGAGTLLGGGSLLAACGGGDDPTPSAAGTTGAMLGNILWYLAARALGIMRLKPIILRWGRWITMSWGEVQRAERWFAKHGTFFVFLGRMLPTVRSLVSVPAGLLKMRFKTFFIASTVGTAGWTALLAFAGFKLGERYDQIDDLLGPASNAIMVVLLLGYIYRVWTHRDIDPTEGDPDFKSL